MQYGLYLIAEEGENPLSLERLITVEGFLIPPRAKVVGVWGSLNYRGQELLEVIPFNGDSPTLEVLDNILSKVVKRLQNRVKFEKEVYSSGDFSPAKFGRIPEKKKNNNYSSTTTEEQG